MDDAPGGRGYLDGMEDPARSSLSPDLLAAYRAAEYRVASTESSGVDPIVLRIDEFSPPLARLLAASRCQCAAFLTACNPLGMRSDPAENRSATLRLHDRLENWVPAGRIFAGEGRDPDNAWLVEASLLALGLDLEASRTLGREFRQNALVWVGPDAIPRLILLR